METLMAIVVGCLFAMSVYLMLRRSLVKLVLGLIMLSNSATLLIFTTAGLVRGKPPLIPEGQETLVGLVADPLPQALILTAIVISFGVLAFAVVLIHRAYEVVGVDDLEEMRSTDT